MKRDPFQILGLTPNATKRDIKKSHRLLSKQFHPDLNPDDPEAAKKFKEVQRAYEALCGKTSPAEVSDRGGSRTGPAPNPANASEKPCSGLFWAWKVCADRIRAQNREKESGVDEVASSAHEDRTER